MLNNRTVERNNCIDEFWKSLFLTLLIIITICFLYMLEYNFYTYLPHIILLKDALLISIQIINNSIKRYDNSINFLLCSISVLYTLNMFLLCGYSSVSPIFAYFYFSYLYEYQKKKRKRNGIYILLCYTLLDFLNCTH